MRTNSDHKRVVLFRSVSVCAIAAISAAMGGQALAQETAAEDEVIEEVVITGSRTIRDGSQAPTPLAVVSAEQLQATAPRNITEGLASMPAFRSVSTTSTPASTASSNTAGSFLNLRNLGSERTLVLLDGRRVAPGATNGSINIDLIPQSLVRRVDVVTGGASAGYGSDAVAGVVGFVLDTSYTGIKGTVQGGISDRGDLGSYKFEISAGGNYWDDRLHLMASYTRRRINPEGSLLDRPWNRPMGGLIAGIAATTSFPPRQILDNVVFAAYNGGVILASQAQSGISFATGVPTAPGSTVSQRANTTSFSNPTALQNTKFLQDGVSSPYNIGTFYNGSNQVGGDGFVNYTSLGSLAEVESSFARADFEISENLRVFGQFATAEVHNRYEVSIPSTVQATPFTIFEDNVFLPAATRAAMLAATYTTDTFVADPAATLSGGQRKTALGTRSQCNLSAGLPEVGSSTTAPFIRCVKMSRYDLDFGRLTGDIRSQSSDYLVGFEATVFGDWSFDGYYEHGRNLTTTYNYNNLTFENAFAAADAIDDPRTPGVVDPICRVTVTNPGAFPGCAPLNLFGHNESSQASYDFAATDGLFLFESIQDVAAFNVRGEPFELPAGRVVVAFGGEYRKLSVEQKSDADSQVASKFTGARAGVRGVPAQFIAVPGGRAFSNLLPFSGEYDVKEVYLETQIPLLKDLPLIQDLSLNAAGRYTNYSTSGEVNTWKVGASYQPIESIRFRGTISRDIRAPNSVELFQTGSRFQRTFNDPFNSNLPTTAFDVAIGDPSLSPEVADTKTFGAVFTPSWLPGFTATLDFYDIEIKGALENLSAQQTLDECFKGSADICDNIQHTGAGLYNGTSQIQTVLLPYVNLSAVISRGTDLEIGYRTELFSIPGEFNFRAMVGYLDKQIRQVPGNAAENRAGTVIATDDPRLRGTLTVTWENGPVGFTWQQEFIGHGLYDNTYIEGVTMNDNTIGTYSSTDLTGRYKFGVDQQYEAFLTINNLFDKEPPYAPGGSVTSFFQTNVSLYDQQGRYYTTGLRFRF